MQEFDQEFSISLMLDANQQCALSHFMCLVYCFQNNEKRNYIEKYSRFFNKDDRYLLEKYFRLISHLDFSGKSFDEIEEKSDVINNFINSYTNRSKNNFDYSILNQDFSCEVVSTLFYYFYVHEKNKLFLNQLIKLYPLILQDKIKYAILKINSFIKTYGAVIPAFESIESFEELDLSIFVMDKIDKVNLLFREKPENLRGFLASQAKWSLSYDKQYNDRLITL